ncbi:MAG: VanZ family protein [Clostridiales bacterium]|nr:VanZ family protein [Clostridiales bacterium]
MKNLKALFLILIIAHMAIIFAFSSQAGEDSGKLSGYVVSEQKKVTKKISENVTDYGITYIDDFIAENVRSMAHCFLYSVLAVLIFTELKLRGIKGLQAAALSIALCFLYGVTDEFHQSFVPGRDATVGDVTADTAGAAAGVVICFIAIKIYEIIKLRKTDKRCKGNN